MPRPSHFKAYRPPSPPAPTNNRNVAPSQSDADSAIETSGMSATDCRTRNNAFSLKNSSSRKSSNGTTYGANGSNLDNSPVRIFEHSRLPQSEVEDDLNQTTEVKFPSTFQEVEDWMDDLVEAALRASGDEPSRTSSIKILFLDEKKCAKVLGEEFPMNRLQPKLKILDWCTSHYMSTFCRFPLPLDLDGEDDVHHVWDWRFTISHPFDWDMLWVYFPTTRTSVGIVRTWFDGYDINFTQMENEVTNFVGPTLANPMLLGLLALQVLTSDSMANVREKGNRIYESQTMTGFHNYNRLRVVDIDDEDNPNHDLGIATRKIIGAACNMTGWENASLQLVKFATFIQDQSRRFAEESSIGPSARSERRLCTYIHEQSLKLIGDLDGAYHDAQAWLATAQFLLQGVLNVLGQKDATVNIELSKDQKRIAEETKRDSTSMTAIAVVTMCFLPGTFTASFFALPFFETDVGKGIEHFWMYWAVTVPLTVITLGAWTLWTRYMNPPIQSAKTVKFQRDKEKEEVETKTSGLIQEWLTRTRTRSVAGQGGQRSVRT